MERLLLFPPGREHVALTLAFPIATLYLLIDNAMTLFVMPFFLHRADRYVEQDDARGVKRMHFLGGFVVKSLPRGLFVGIAFYLGSPFMQMVLEKIPDFVQTGLAQRQDLFRHWELPCWLR